MIRDGDEKEKRSTAQLLRKGAEKQTWLLWKLFVCLKKRMGEGSFKIKGNK